VSDLLSSGIASPEELLGINGDDGNSTGNASEAIFGDGGETDVFGEGSGDIFTDSDESLFGS
jgi:hypothetical protein